LQYVIALMRRKFVANANSSLVGLFLLIVVFFCPVKCLAMISAYVVFGLLHKFASCHLFHFVVWIIVLVLFMWELCCTGMGIGWLYAVILKLLIPFKVVVLSVRGMW